MNAVFRMTPLAGGGNNRGFRVDSNGKKYFLKIYARRAGDDRNRLRNEFGFCRFVWGQRLKWVPKPLAKDEPGHIGLYEFIEGRLLSEKDVTPRRVKEAARFFIDVNKRRHSAAAKKLPAASEACFSIEGHLKLVSGRVSRLGAIKTESADHRAAIRFVRTELAPAWKKIAAQVRREAKAAGFSLCQAARLKDRWLSPSDFGFHNAVITESGRLRFFDFEYAGWDDLSKTICDFALQPRLPFPRKLMPLFARPILSYVGDGERQMARARILYPVFALKWCCIILNSFLRPSPKKELTERLKKAKEYLTYALKGRLDF